MNIKRWPVQIHVKLKGTPKFTTGYFIALQKEEIQFHTTENRHKLPKQGNLDKPLVQLHPQGADSTIKRNHKLQDCKRHPKHSNLNKMKRQRNIQQVKEQIKNHQKKKTRKYGVYLKKNSE